VKKAKSEKTEKEPAGESDADDDSAKSAAESDEELDKSDDVESPKVRLVDKKIFRITADAMSGLIE